MKTQDNSPPAANIINQANLISASFVWVSRSGRRTLQQPSEADKALLNLLMVPQSGERPTGEMVLCYLQHWGSEADHRLDQ